MSVQTRVDKTCEWNRYCSFTGPFYSEHVMEIGAGRPRLVARCYACGTYVCNRCARRRVFSSLEDKSVSSDVWELLCRYDDRPLGRDDAWVLVTAGGISRITTGTAPTLSAIYRAVPARSDQDSRVRDLLSQAVILIGDKQYEAADGVLTGITAPEHCCPSSMALHVRTNEKTGRLAEAWSVLRMLFDCDVKAVSDGLAVLAALNNDPRCNKRIVDDSISLLSMVLRASRNLEVLDRKWEALLYGNRLMLQEMKDSRSPLNSPDAGRAHV